MVDARVALAIEEPGRGFRGAAGEGGEDDGPVAGLLAGDGDLEGTGGGGRAGAGVPVEEILGEAAEGFEG